MPHKHRPGRFQGLCPWPVQGRALVLLPFPGFLVAGTDMRSWRRGAQASALGLCSWIRAGKGKTYWTKPHPVPRGLWALNAPCSSADAPSEHSGWRIEGLDQGNQAFSPASQAGSDCFDYGWVPEWLSLDKPPHPDLAVASGSCGLRAGAGS
jgi:hypothetical protein